MEFEVLCGGVPVFSKLSTSPVSVRQVTQRFRPAGKTLRALANGSSNVWSHLDRTKIVSEISDRLRDPMIMQQSPTGLCGPFAILVDFARRDLVRYVNAAKELLETGKLTCPSGRVIEAESELRQEPVVSDSIGQVDWLLAATMRDDENIWEDIDDDANGLESMTFWGEQRGWIRDVLDLAGGGWETCCSWGDKDCMKKAEAAVKAGGVAHLLIDANMIKDGGSDNEEDLWHRRSNHQKRTAPTRFPSKKKHSKDDDFPPDHWVVYLGGFNLGNNPGDNDPVKVQIWSWGGRYEVTGTVDAFTEYLYAVCTGH